MQVADITIIGGGIAGISAAARVAEAMPDASVLVLEGEDSLAYHATGRSAAMYIRNYGPPAIRKLNILSEGIYLNPEGFSDVPLLARRGEMLLDTGRTNAFDRYMDGSSGLEIISSEEACKIVPVLRPEYVKHAAYEPDASDIDVHQLLTSFQRLAKAHGVLIKTRARVERISREGGSWKLRANGEEIATKIVVNAAGAWVDQIAEMAGLAPKGIKPMRRSAVLIPQPDGIDFSSWPLTVPAEEDWYIRPDSGRLMISPADEDPVDAMDVYPDDMVLAEGVHRFEEASTMTITRIEHQWAGLRSFAPDRNPVCGFASDGEGFFWLAGQGGYGIQTAPAMAMVAAGLIASGNNIADDELLAMISPDRVM